jgi:hypothetical protein
MRHMSKLVARTLLMGMAGGIAGLAVMSDPADAQRRPTTTPAAEAEAGGHPSSRYYRRAPQVRSFIQRRGGYSYSYNDVINTYGNSRTVYGSTNTYRNPYLDLQSRSGPFDHGFFFDSGISPRGGNAPY